MFVTEENWQCILTNCSEQVMEVTVFDIFQGSGEGHVAIFSDITTLKEIRKCISVFSFSVLHCLCHSHRHICWGISTFVRVSRAGSSQSMELFLSCHLDASKHYQGVRFIQSIFTLNDLYLLTDDCLMSILNFGRQCYNSPDINQCTSETVKVWKCIYDIQ